MTIDQAHIIATSGDRIFHVEGHVRGEWYSDRVLDFMLKHRCDECEEVVKNKEIISVRLLEDKK